MYISIGRACCVKYQIDQYFGKKETNFFDWLISSMNSVITVLKCKNIDELLNFNNIYINPKIPYSKGNTGKNTRVVIRSLYRCISIHDVKTDFNNDDIYDFIDKYKRRWNRMIEYIKQDEKIYFIRFGEIKPHEKEQFIQTILGINENCNFYLISIIDSNIESCIINLVEELIQQVCHHILENEVSIEPMDNTHPLFFSKSESGNIILKDDHYLELRINNYLINTKHDWKKSYLHWKQIFIDIENNTK